MDLADELLAQQALAVAGVSRSGAGFGYKVWRHLQRKGIRVYPLNPSAGEIEGEAAYVSVGDLPEPVGGVITVTPPQATEQVVRACIAASVTRVWMQPGSESAEAVRLAREAGMQVSTGACMLLL
jgi:predicted CoA-binding protein